MMRKCEDRERREREREKDRERKKEKLQTDATLSKKTVTKYETKSAIGHLQSSKTLQHA